MPRFPSSTPSISAIPSTVYSPLAHRLAHHEGERFPFHVGDTWMEPPEGCRMEDLSTAENPGMHRYPPVNGVPALVDALCARSEERHGVPTTAENVLVTAGATAGLGSIAMAVVAPGDEVLLLAPYWPLIAGIVRCVQGVPVPVPLFHAGAPSPEQVTEALAAALTERTVAVYLNTPNNPTGHVMPRDVVAAVVRFAEQHDLWIWADDVYEDLQFEGEHVPTRALCPDRTFSCHSFSKQAGMAGNRVGWIAGPKVGMDEVRKAALYTLYSAPTASQLAAARTLGEAGRSWAADARVQYAHTAKEVAALL
ncbi:MAG: pyridoxal phosphate-dependent aminotransferase, partial [Myxococcales bacterium]|nr:pyridoxal phosphate-dependent aminotransferase [Myxococcales bacterium]